MQTRPTGRRSPRRRPWPAASWRPPCPTSQRVDITKVAPITSGEATWEAEAEVWQPNATLKTLGLETGRPVLDHSHYLIRLDALLNVLEYELEQT